MRLNLQVCKNFYDGKAIRFSADEALINGDFSEGIIRSANLLLDETIKIHTAEVILKDGEISSATRNFSGYLMSGM